MDTTKNCRLQSWTLYKSADCRWISLTKLCVSFTNSATVGRLEQVQLCNRLIDQSADNITRLKCAKECLILKYISISRILDVICCTKGVTLVYLYLNTVIHWTSLTRQKSKWVDSLYYTTIRTCLYMKRHDLGQYPTELLWRHLFAKLDFITDLRRLINCSTPKTASYNYSVEKLLWNMKFYLNQYFSQTSSHEIVRRNVKLTRENLNLDSKIKHLSPVYKKDIEKLRRRQKS